MSCDVGVHALWMRHRHLEAHIVLPATVIARLVIVDLLLLCLILSVIQTTVDIMALLSVVAISSSAQMLHRVSISTNLH